jgi:50S ribosomal subunit-associated GTPase HflX
VPQTRLHILVFNKIDLYKPSYNDDEEEEEAVAISESTLEQLKKSYIADKADHVVFISAEKKENMRNCGIHCFAREGKTLLYLSKLA